jgi:hypothetical protein
MGKVALVLMLAGNAETKSETSKAFTQLQLAGNPTLLEVLMRRYVSYLSLEFERGSLHSEKSSTRSNLKLKNRPTPIIVICNEHNYERVRDFFQKHAFFGL